MAGWRRTMHGEWIQDGVGLVAHAEAFGWFAHPFGGGPPLGPFADDNAAKSALEREEQAEAPGGAEPGRLDGRIRDWVWTDL